MLNQDIIRVGESMMSLLALITEFRSNSGFVPNYPLMPLGDVVLITTFSVCPSKLNCYFCDQDLNKGLVRILEIHCYLQNLF